MRQEVADIDPRLFSIGKLRPELREPARHGISELDRATLNQRHRCRGDNRLCKRRVPEDGIRSHFPTRLPIGKPGRSLDDGLAISFNEDNSADEPLTQRCSLQAIRHTLF
jgi:hypothetical protein